MSAKPSTLSRELEVHRQNLEEHFRKASEFLVKCQIAEPYVEKGTLHGCVCPWEIGEHTEEGRFPILEDFHDTLESIWVWCLYTKISGKKTFRSNIDWAWKYIVNNWKRFIGEKESKSLYDCSCVLFSGVFYERTFNNDKYDRLILQAGNRLDKYLSKLKSTEGREYYDPFWMAYCLNLAAKSLKQKKWLETSENFVKNTIVRVERPFSKVGTEPEHKGPGGHDFFSKNANRALALTSCFGREKVTKDIIAKNFLPCLPRKFVSRPVDGNAWNAHLATAIGKSYTLTGNKEFLNRFFAIMDELKARDVKKSAALPRSPSFSRRESWVTFFYAHAYASVIIDFANLM
ncbi:MAG: hypothetical protein OEY22_04825 [Candidatus Bathyarchaeota archaeon]|nr:hypothetical protein [Candidatus Bathyarchaeota archaeon]MDH5787317.1 hypothetical protein [Candidatus Bathyarchaeota archaeon]